MIRDCTGVTTAEGWLNLATGEYTEGVPPEDAGTCSAACAEIVSVCRCDDTDGDGEANERYTELWCVATAGTTSLLLTYQGDPGTEYVPVSPVTCVTGQVTTTALVLCDDAGSFLRRITWAGDEAVVEDVALDGQTPYVVTGDAHACDDNPCEARTTPVATTGLCLADGTPIAVVVTRDCAGVATQDGWINLSTAAFSAGAPPAGTIACGDSRSIQVSGTFCDVDETTGDVLGLVLIEYAYAADGSIEGVRLVDAVTGDTYTPQGQVTTCPAGVEQPERDLVQLCDVNDDESGTVTTVPFLRDYARDENGAITGHSDYTLEGEPYTPSGIVGVCPAKSLCRDCQTLALCDVPTYTAPAPVVFSGTGPQSGTAANGVDWSINSGPSSSTPGWIPIALFPAPATGPEILTLTRPAAVSWSARVGINGASTGRIVMPVGSKLVDLSPLHTYDPATRTLGPAAGAGMVDANGSSRFSHPGPVTSLTFATDGVGGVAIGLRQVGEFSLTAATVPFLRTTCRDCDGLALDSTDTLLDGTTAYTPVGTVGVCHPPETEPCASTVEILRLCDLNPDAVPDETGKRCAIPFLRHLIHDCTGALVETRDTTMDGTTTYTAVEVVDCGSGGVPALVEVPWSVVSVEPDPDAVAGRGFLFSLSPDDDPGTVGVVKVTTTSVANTTCPATFPDLVFSNPCTYIYEPDQVLKDNATYIRVDLADFDTFEPAGSFSPRPDRIGGTAYWDGATLRPTESNGTGQMFYDGPPDTWSFRIGNTGGGNSCSGLSFAAVSLRPEGCCGCGTEGEECRDSAVVLLCDDPAPDGVPPVTVAPTVTDTSPIPYFFTGHNTALPGGGQSLWSGGTLTFPAETSNAATGGPQIHRCIAGYLQAPAPECHDGTATVAVSVDVQNLGPNGAVLTNGRLRLLTASGTQLANSTANNTGVGTTRHLAVNAAVDPALADAGDLVVWIDLETWDQSGSGGSGAAPKTWEARNLTATVYYGQAGCVPPTQFLRTVVTDCETGAVVSTTDATLDGAPYTVTGDVGQCETTGGATACCPPTVRSDTELLPVCFFDADGALVQEALAEYGYDTITGVRVRDRYVDLTTGDPVEIPAGATVGVCPPKTPCTDSFTQMLCDETVEVTWTQQSVVPDPAQPAGRGFIFTLSPSDDPSIVGTISVLVDRTNGSCGADYWPNGATFTYTLDAVAQTMETLRVNLEDFDTGESITMLSGGAPDRLGGNAYAAAGGLIRSNVNNQYGYMFFDSPPAGLSYRFAGSCIGLNFNAVSTRTVQFLRKIVTDCETGEVVSVTDMTVDGQPYTVSGDIGDCTVGTGQCCPDSELLALCDTAGDGTVTGFLRHLTYLQGSGIPTVTDTLLDGVTEYAPSGTVGVCAEACRDTSSTLLCDTAAQEALTVFDPSNIPGSDGWQVVRFTGIDPMYPAEAALPYDAPHPAGSPAFMGARSDLNAGIGTGGWPGYDGAPHRWVLRKTFTAPEDGIAVVTSAGFRGDGGARVRVNSVDAGLYGQWNQPATAGTAQIPVTAGPNTVEIEVRDGGGPNWVQGRLDIVMAATVQFMRRTVVDCDTGETVSVIDTTLDGEPYQVTGLVGQCEPVAECCEQAPPEQRVDVESELLCIRDEVSGDVVGQVVVERVYDDQSGDRLEQRLTDPTTGDLVELPAGAILARCPSPDRITRQICVVESGQAEFLTNSANAASGADSDWTWAPDLSGTWYPMYRVTPNPAWTLTDPAPNPAHWVAPHQDKTVCSPTQTAPPVTATWFTRASWNLPSNVDPDSIRIAASVLNADNDVVQWRLNDGPWQPVGIAVFIPPAWTFPATAVPGGRAGQNDVIVQILETAPPVSCPSPNQAGLLLHVAATYDYEPRVWTQVIEDSRVYYLDENGDRQDTIPDGERIVPCGAGEGGCCPWRDAEAQLLCDVAEDGTATQFIRGYVYTEADPAGAIVIDTTLDGAPYTPTGEVGQCQTTPAPGRDVELHELCVIDNNTGGSIQTILQEIVYDTVTGDRAGTRYVDLITGDPVALPGGTHIGECPAPEPDEPPVTVLEECRWDDTDGDGIGDVEYVELIGVDADGTLTPIGTYTPGMTGPYTPVAPVADGPVEGASAARGVQAHRLEVAAGSSWSAAAVPLLQSVTVTARGTGTVTTAGGPSPLYEGDSVTWSVVREDDAMLVGPLTITAGTGSVTVAYTQGVAI